MSVIGYTAAAAVTGLALGELIDEYRDTKVSPSKASLIIPIKSLPKPKPGASPFMLAVAPNQTGTPQPPPPAAVKPLGDLGSGSSLKRNRWVSVGKIKGDRKLKRLLRKLRFYSNPPGALYLKSTSYTFNFIWKAMAPSYWQPGHGRAKRRNVRMGPLKPLLGPKADWKTLTGTLEDIIEKVPAIVEGAAQIGGAAATGGAGAGAVDVQGITNTAIDTIKAAGGIISKTQARIDAADAVVGAIWSVWLREFRDANPHVIKSGRVDLGKNYKSSPKTTADLSAPGDSYPWVFVP